MSDSQFAADLAKLNDKVVVLDKVKATEDTGRQASRVVIRSGEAGVLPAPGKSYDILSDGAIYRVFRLDGAAQKAYPWVPPGVPPTGSGTYTVGAQSTAGWVPATPEQLTSDKAECGEFMCTARDKQAMSPSAPPDAEAIPPRDMTWAEAMQTGAMTKRDIDAARGYTSKAPKQAMPMPASYDECSQAGMAAVEVAQAAREYGEKMKKTMPEPSPDLFAQFSEKCQTTAPPCRASCCVDPGCGDVGCADAADDYETTVGDGEYEAFPGSPVKLTRGPSTGGNYTRAFVRRAVVQQTAHVESKLTAGLLQRLQHEMPMLKTLIAPSVLKLIFDDVLAQSVKVRAMPKYQV